MSHCSPAFGSSWCPISTLAVERPPCPRGQRKCLSLSLGLVAGHPSAHVHSQAQTWWAQTHGDTQELGAGRGGIGPVPSTCQVPDGRGGPG